MPRRTEFADLKPMEIEEALRFVVRLANSDIEELERRPDDPEGLPTLLYLLRRYLYVTAEAELKGALDGVEKRPEALKPLVDEMRRLLAAVVEGRFDATEFTLKKARTIRLLERDGELKVQRDGDLREALFETALEDLDETKVRLLRLGHCQREGCDRFFYKVKLNQAYCGHGCANKAAAARRPEGKEGGQKENGTQTQRG